MGDVPLHGERIWDPYFWACSKPGRPCDQFTRYDFRCPACLLAAKAACKLQPEMADRALPAIVGGGANAGRTLIPRTLRERVEASADT